MKLSLHLTIFYAVILAVVFHLSCKPDSTDANKRIVNSASRVFLRTAPGPTAPQTDWLEKGTEVLLTGEKAISDTYRGKTGQWVEVTAGEKKDGYSTHT